MKRFVMPVITALIIAGIVLFAALHGAELPILNPQGPVGMGEKNVILIAALLPAVVVIPVFFLLFYFAWRYRADGPNAHLKHQPNWDHDNWSAEAAWWLVPTVIIIVLGIVAWESSHELDPYKPLASSNPTLTIDVVALDWKWLFIYPQQGIATVNFLEIPMNTPVHFELTADAPMNSFWVPSLGGQIMVMPGMQTQLNLMASKTGTFNGASANISGAGFAGMAFTVRSVSQDNFDSWVAATKQGGGVQDMGPLTMASYMSLEKPSENVPPATYSAVDANLYNEVIMYQMMDGGMPTNMMSGTEDAAGMSASLPAARLRSADVPAASTTSPAQPATSTPAAMPDMPGMEMNGSQDLLMRGSNGTS